MSERLFENIKNLQLLQFAKQKHVSASEIYIPQGKFFKKIFFIKKGTLRSYYLTETGEEKTIFFRWDGQFGAIPECIFDNQTSNQIWQALEDCELFEIDFDLLEEMSENNVQLMKIRMGFVQVMLLEAIQRIEGFVLDKPEARYQKLISQKPEINNRVADKYIASYIGVTPVSLSRIRKRLTSQKK
jgi:CRP-like cAMP-binding protein